MNKTLVALIAGTALLGTAACSSTRTQRAPGEQVDDAALLTSVKSALASDPVTEAGEINVDVNRGVVKLAGFVDTSQEKSKAGDIARQVDRSEEHTSELRHLVISTPSLHDALPIFVDADSKSAG